MTVHTPRGEGRSMTPLYPTSVTVNFEQDGADWFGPLTPIHPAAPPEVAGRQWDYAPGYNLTTVPRQFEPVTFQTLRILADSYDPLRLVIERRKDQLCRLPWTVRVKSTGKRPTKAQLSAATQNRIEEITQLFECPSRGVSFRTFLRGITEDLLVIDAPSIYLRRDSRGDLSDLQFMDGALINPLIDERGRQPEPRAWKGEPFAWNGKTITRDNFADEGFKYLNGLAWPPIAQQILKGLPAANLTELDLLYRPMNVRPGHGPFGFSPCEQVLTTVAIAMRRTSSQLEYFREGSQPDAMFTVPESWTPDQIQRYQDYWDSLLSGNLGQRRKLKFVPGGSKSNYIATKEPPLKNELDAWLARIVCFAFSYPPTPFVDLSNRSVSEQHERTAEEEGLEPLKQHTADIFNEVIRDHLGEDEIEFAWVEANEVDQKVQSEILNDYVANGVLSINEARERIGEEPSTDPAANQLMVKTATGFVPIGACDDDANDHDDQAVADDADAQKLRKAAITMTAPPKWKPRARFKLGATTYLPNLETRELLVFSEDDAIALEAFGWQRK